ncbi:MAG: hypothetical protein V4555_16330 [Acidobacteriota bacterium]
MYQTIKRHIEARRDKPAALCALLLTFGCNSTPTPSAPKPTQPTLTYPARPTTTPPPFKLFHTTPDSITLTTTEQATDDQIAAIVYQLHDAAQSHTFDALHLPQKLIDARSPYIWFHLYRGTKCASEKYTQGKLPCGNAYHAAADYTLGGFKNPNHDDGLLLHNNGQSTELWNPDAPATH